MGHDMCIRTGETEITNLVTTGSAGCSFSAASTYRGKKCREVYVLSQRIEAKK